MKQTYVIAGNGPSLAQIDPGLVMIDDFIIRTNSFFLEPQYHLSNRVDLALIAGDPRVAPFVFATLKEVSDHYDIRNWSTVKERLIPTGRKFLPRGYLAQTLDDDVRKRLEQLQAEYQAEPTAGIRAILMAHGLGAQSIILAGIDLYAGPDRYVYNPGRHMRDLLGNDLAMRPYDMRLHHPDLDLALLDYMANRSDLTLKHTTKKGPLDAYLDLAMPRMGTPVTPQPKPKVDDWVAWAGWYPIVALKLMRKMRAVQRSTVFARGK